MKNRKSVTVFVLLLMLFHTISTLAPQTIVAASIEDNLVLHYDMKTTEEIDGQLIMKDVSENDIFFDGIFRNSENGQLVTNADVGYVSFDGGGSTSNSGYIEISEGLLDGEDSLTVSSLVNWEASNSAEWLYAFGQNSSRYLYYTPKYNADSSSRFGIATDGWRNEVSAKDAADLTANEWKLVTTVFSETEETLTLYIDGDLVATEPTTGFTLDAIRNEGGISGYIGKSMYPNDPYFGGMIADFQVFNTALSATEISELKIAADARIEDMGGLLLENVANKLDDSFFLNQNESKDQIKTKLNFSENGPNGTALTWESNNPEIISNDGTVNRPSFDQGSQEVMITVKVSDGTSSVTKEFTVTVINKRQASEAIVEAAEKLQIHNSDDVRGNLTLPTNGENGTIISWASEQESIITTTGEVTRPANNEGDVQITLTATLTLDDQTMKKVFTANVLEMPESEEFKGYFFPYMTGEGSADGEQVYFALSEGNDPLNWQLLNDGETVLTSELGEEGVRDPYILRSPEGDKFYLIATDLKMYGNGDWGRAQTDGSHSIMVWESTDLVNWTDQRLVEVAPPEAGNTWAPEFFYDDTTGEYIVFWASKLYDNEADRNSGNSYQRMMYTKTRDFHTFTEPEVYLDYGYSIIDTTMIKHDGKIYRFTKDERGNTAASPNGKFIFQEVGNAVLDPDFALIKEGIGKGAISQGEGATVFKSNTEEKWYLFIDEYGGRGYVPFETTDLDSGEWTLSEDYDLPNRPRHGTVMPITQTEYDALLANEPDLELPDEEERVTAVTLVEETTELTEGEEIQLTVKVTPETAENKAVVWTSNNEKVATVDQTGKVTAIKAGTARITVTTDDGGHMAVSEVTVKAGVPDDGETNEIRLGEPSQVIVAGETYTIKGTSTKITMPTDLPTGTKLKVELKNSEDTNHDGLTSAGDQLTFLFDFPSDSIAPSAGYLLEMGYQKAADSTNVGIYYYNEETDKWEIREGDVDSERQRITLLVSEFSTYGVFAKTTQPEEDNQGNDEGEVEENDQDVEVGQVGEDGKAGDDKKAERGQNAEKPLSERDRELPDTATNLSNYLLIGMTLLGLGGVTALYVRKRKFKI